MIVASPAADEPTMENLMSHATSCGKPMEPAMMLTAKQKSRWSGRKPPNQKPPNRKLPNPKPPNQKPSNQKPSNQKPPNACHGEFDKKAGVEWARWDKASHHIKLANNRGHKK